MILLVDIGNTRLKWATASMEEYWPGGTFPHDNADPALPLAAAWETLERPERVLMVSVAAPAIADAVNAWMQKTWQCTAEIPLPRRKLCGVVNGYVHPQHLGADRWTALIGAHALAPGNVCVIDCGSAITIDVMATDGRHLGGLILPGLALMERTLRDNTQIAASRFKGNSASAEVALLARDTAGAVRGGILYSVIATIDRVTADLRSEFPQAMHCILTGGDAERLLPLLAGTYIHAPELVLRGLWELAKCDNAKITARPPSAHKTAPAAEEPCA